MKKYYLLLVFTLAITMLLFHEKATAKELYTMYEQAQTRGQTVKYCKSLRSLYIKYPSSVIREDVLRDYRTANCNKILSKKR